jgi:hypothetical protein
VPPSTLRRLNAKRAGAAVSAQQAQPRKDHLLQDCAAIRFSQFLFFAPFEGHSAGGAEQGTGGAGGKSGAPAPKAPGTTRSGHG